jgi:outer membrane murein-binding lipoprotein Lpp
MAVPDDSPVVARTVENVRLRKFLDEQEYDVPTVAYELESKHEDPVEVTIREAIPASVSIEDIGFHRRKGADYWDVDGDELVFEYTLSAGEAFTTIYAIRTDTTLRTTDLLTPPKTAEVESVGSEVPQATPMTRSSAESPYESQGPNAAGTARETETTPAGGVDLGEELAEPGDNAVTSEESLADRLAAEIRAGEASAESLNVLQDSLLNEALTGGAVDARLTQLQQDVGDLRAYKNALESFLEDKGSAQEIIESFETRLDEVESEMASLRSAVETVESRSDANESDIQSIDADLDELSSDHETLVGEFESLADDVDSMDEHVPDYPIDDRMDELEAEIESVGEFVETLKTAFE